MADGSNTRGALLVDLDGTLVDTAPDMIAALQRLGRAEGKGEVCQNEARAAVGSGAHAMLQLVFSGQEMAARGEILLQRFLADYSANVAAASTLYSGWENVFNVIGGLDWPWGIVTNKPERISARLVSELGLTTRCGCLIGGDTLPERKPSPVPLIMGARKLGRPAGDCWYVGDHKRDIDAGRAAGMRTLAARWGYLGTDDDPADWGADFIIDTPDELAEILAGRHLP